MKESQRVPFFMKHRVALQGVYTIEQTSSRRLANVEQMSSKRRAISTCILNSLHLLNVCSTFARSCKHPIRLTELRPSA